LCDNLSGFKGEQRLIFQEGDVSANIHQGNEGQDWILSIMRRTNEIIGADDLSCLIQDFLDLMIEICQAESADFFQLDEATDDLVMTHSSGNVERRHLIGLRFNRRHQGLPGVFLNDLKIFDGSESQVRSDSLQMVDPVTSARAKNLINLPVVNKESTLGVIQIFNFQQPESELLSILSIRLAIEIDRRRELNVAQRSNERLLTLVDMLREVAGTLDRNRLMHMVTENAARLVDSERSSLFLVDPTTSEMMFQVAYQPPVPGEPPPPSEDLDRHPRYSRLKQPGQENSSHKHRPVNMQQGEFSYFNRSAITVPLRSAPLEADQDEDRMHVIGGLMVLNKPGASFQEEDAQLMRILANQTSTFLQVAEVYESTEELFLGVIKSLVTAIDAKDPYTQGHSQRVSDYSVSIARELELDDSLVNDIRIGSLLHDIGKIGIPDAILLKNGTLNNEENGLIREHPRTGVNILSQVKLLDPMRPAILEHHERLDGSGYPAKLVDKQISWMGRIVAVADVFDAMTSNRPYREAMSVSDVLSYLRQNVGILFDGRCVQALDTILARTNQVPDNRLL
jgi:putative nucleotidyltransferase with HDIG domain